MSNVKKRNWAFIIYQESVKSDWLNILQLRGVACAISPLHDKDINPDGSLKKPHTHIILSFNNPTTFKNVCEISDSIGGVMPIPLDSVVGYYRYLTHKDNPEKAQYNEDEIILLNGFDPVELLTESEITNRLKQILDVIRLNHFVEFQDLVDYLCEHDLHDHLVALEKHPYFIHLYINSKRHKIIDNFR